MIDDLGIIVAAAGSGERYGGRNKLLEPLGELPLFIHCLQRFITLCPAGHLVLVVSHHEQHGFSTAIKRFMPDVEIAIIEGGNYRAQSIVNGLQQLPKNVNYVAIHDAARPFASVELLERCLAAARQHGGAIPAKPVTDTLKQVDGNGFITATVCREQLWRVETPSSVISM
ncbi:MAG: 2-C-methyl-D-erythritol 4-phosphate cytidylyltransferase [Victivallaceae bacterium]|nr:2-C-methyl-D-erythritol 4-phosphate cytidylyltransferase [Victivallaceae bacterium]